MEIAEHIDYLDREGALLAAAIERVPLATPVPTCPGWQVRDLLAHLGFVHRWAAGYVSGAITEMVPAPGDEEVLVLAPGDDSLHAWFRAGHAGLVAALRGADPALRAWTFLAAASPLAFWSRRQAHETAVHRADAQLAAAAVIPGAVLDPYPAALAADGIDELVMGFAARNPRRLSDAPAVLTIRALDAGPDAAWTVAMGQDAAGAWRGEAAVAGAAGHRCVVSGAAEDLYLMLWNRRPAAGLDVCGDAAVLDGWRDKLTVRWR